MRILLAAHTASIEKTITAELRRLQENGQQAFLLVPEQFTMQTDRTLLQNLEGEVLMDIRVVSFASLARQVLSRAGGARTPYVNENGRRMIVQYLLNTHKRSLPMYGSGAQQRGISQKLAETLGDFRSAAVEPQALDRLADREDVPAILKDKLSETALLYRAYLDLLGDRAVDNAARLHLLAEKLPQADWLRCLSIYLEGFHSLSQPEMAVLEKLHDMGAQITLGLELSAAAARGQAGPTETQIYSATARFYQALCRRFPVQTDLCADQADILGDLDAFSRQVLGSRLHPIGGRPPHLSIWKAVSPQMEVLSVCGMIRQKVIDQGRRWKDFQIVTNQPALYYPLFERAFAQYHIPAFIDERKPMSYHYFVRFIFNVLDAVNTRFSYPVLFACLKSGLTPLNDEEITALDYFARARHLRGTMYFDPDMFEAPEEAVHTKNADRLRARQSQAYAAHEKFTAWFRPFFEDIRQASTVRQHAALLYYFVTDAGIMDAFHAHDGEKSPEQVAVDEQILQATADLLDQLVETMGDMELSTQQFTDIVKEGFANASLGIVPPAQDQVTVASLARARRGRIPIEVIVGCADAWMPDRAVNHTVFVRQEKEWLDAHGITLPSGEQMVRDDENLSIFDCLCRPTEQLILSYPLGDASGAALHAAAFVQHALTVFPDLEEKSLLADFGRQCAYLDWESLKAATGLFRLAGGQEREDVGEAAAIIQWFTRFRPQTAEFLRDGLYYENMRQALPETVAQALYPAVRKGKISASELETYKICPYKHFMKYGIQPEESTDYTLQPDEMGSVLHGCLDRLTADLCAHPDLMNMTDQEIAAHIDGYLTAENQAQLDRQRRQLASNAAMVRKVRRQTLTAGRYILDQLRTSSFAPRYHEAPFAQSHAPFPPVYIDLGDRMMRIEGRIDRVDTATVKGRPYVCVIDYKSGSKRFDLSSAWDGLDMQLLLYLRAALGAKDAPLPAGVFYMSMKEPLQNTDSLSEQEIREAFSKQLLLDGVFINDPDVIAALDQATSQGKTRVIRFAGRGKTPDNSLDDAAFAGLLDHALEAATDTLQAIIQGDISVYPVDESKGASCSFCDYKAMCRSDETVGMKTRLPESLSYSDLAKKFDQGGEDQ
jgi:ATP-dependent helicase/nuclease subunit B